MSDLLLVCHDDWFIRIRMGFQYFWGILSVLSIFLTTFYYPFFCLIIEFWSTPGFFWSTPGLLWVNSGFAFEVRSINRPVIYLTTCKSRPLYIRNTHVVWFQRSIFFWLGFTLYSAFALGWLRVNSGSALASKPGVNSRPWK